MKNKNFYSKTISGILFCLCFIIYGTMIFIKAEQIDYSTCVYLFKSVIPYSILIALLGYFIGKIIDDAGKKRKK